MDRKRLPDLRNIKGNEPNPALGFLPRFNGGGADRRRGLRTYNTVIRCRFKNRLASFDFAQDEAENKHTPTKKRIPVRLEPECAPRSLRMGR